MKKALSLTLVITLLIVLFAACSSATPSASNTPDSTPPGETASSAPATQSEPTAGGDWDFSNDKTYNLTFSLYLPAGNSSFSWLDPLCQELSAATDGTVNIEVFPGGTLAAGDETADAIKNGVADMGLWPTAYALGTFPLSYMLEYPGIEYGSAKAASYAFQEWLDVLQPAEIQDFKMLFAYCSGPGIFLSSSKELKSLDDFNGMQIRTNAINAPAVSAYGGTPVTLAVSEVYEAMRTGVIDGYCGLTESLLSFKLQEVTKYALLNPNFQCAFMVLMNKQVYESMSEGQQRAIDEISRKIWEETACCYLERDYAATAIKALEDAGVVISTFSDEDLATMSELTSNLLTDYAAGLDNDGIKGTEALTLLKELVEKYKEIYPTN